MAKTRAPVRRSITSSPAYQKAQTQLAAARRRLAVMRKSNKGAGSIMKVASGAIGGGVTAAAAQAFVPLPFARAIVGAAQVAIGALVVKKGAAADAMITSGAGCIACEVEDLAAMFLPDPFADDGSDEEEG